MINTFRIFIIESKTGKVLAIHESFCLWESKVMSFMNTSTMDYILLTQNGIQVLTLDKSVETKKFRDDQN